MATSVCLAPTSAMTRSASLPTERACPSFTLAPPRSNATGSFEFFAQPDGLYLGADKVQLRGINWFGCETTAYCPHGLWAQSLDSLLDTIQTTCGFNAIRFIFSAEFALGLDTLKVGTVNGSLNPGLDQMTAGQMLDYVIDQCRRRGIVVMLCMYRFTAQGEGISLPELWYDDNAGWPEGKVVQAWTRIAARYANNPAVFALDIKNEPHGRATWAKGDISTDWAKAVERLGNALQAVAPQKLIFAEGVDSCDDGSFTFWGGAIDGLKRYVPSLSIPNKLVFSPHVYGPGHTPNMDCFLDPSFPSNMPAVWDKDWGFCAKQKMGCLVLGEWGGVCEGKDAVWHEALVDYLSGLGCNSQFYWALNANSGADTGGLLGADWSTINKSKLAYIQRMAPNPTKFVFDRPAAS